MNKILLSELNHMHRADFTTALGAIFEHSPWVAEQTAAARPFADVAALHAAMVAQIEAAGEAAQLKLIRAHPELGGKLAVAGALTAESTQEQAGAGLNQCSPQEFAELTDLNARYGEKFGFPFILAVRGHDRQSIIAEFRRRIGLTPAQEQQESLRQIYRIGLLRLQDLVQI
ncbi:2-oxo-4-hydroxy-4-carboxy-5-ureidoimidazoline decarboxylase [Uruburuella testudinis]|uniref:2-oxo-4-hydroxy-4-carboxy-5-ureidoimidazoline decarboxylase n=1 Tax=Uruburuella testudinis TaxID=1282863 RepID=A0ABY4DQE8_9NEIS|nr:2-oxo-4-hydroxy-4-carboxy-5-ureidoimidazoline decarboxylase [Uruburuella testudinis]UOO81287.1 2-oxo-4-hydroxy-4-carboxy-5-ureidoimidazoline decarboxylase [Uruburuella testudinis]